MSHDIEFERRLREAQGGDCVSMLYVADCYSDGSDVEIDERLAAFWYRKAAKRGVVDAMYELARCYSVGTGVPQDRDLCRQWLYKAYAADHLITISAERVGRVRGEVQALLLKME